MINFMKGIFEAKTLFLVFLLCLNFNLTILLLIYRLMCNFAKKSGLQNATFYIYFFYKENISLDKFSL